MSPRTRWIVAVVLVAIMCGLLIFNLVF